MLSALRSFFGYDGTGRLLAWFSLALALGAGVYFIRPAEPSAAMMGIVGLALVAASGGVFLTWRRGGVWPGQGLVLILAAGSLTGFCVGALHTHARATPMLDSPLERVMVEGWITGIDPHESGSRLRIRVHAISDWPATLTPQTVRLTERNDVPLSPGRFVRCYASLLPPPAPGLGGDHDFRITAYFEGLGAVGYVMGRCRPGALGPSIHHRFELALEAVRRSISLRVAQAAGERAGGFAAGMVTGDRSLMDEADAEALRASGLAHILAISGLNLAIVGGLVYAVIRTLLSLWPWLALRVPVQKPAAAAALIVVTGYFVLSGMTVAPQRAWIMSVIFFGAILLDRAALSRHSLALALSAAVLVDPAGVLTPGFQMSFATTAVLVAAFEQWNQRPRRRGPGPPAWWKQAIAGMLISSGLGTLTTIPIGLFHFDRTAPFGLIANLVAMPIITLIATPGAGLALFLWPIGLQDIGLTVMGWGLELVLAVAHWSASEGESLERLTNQHAMSAAALIVFLFAIFLYAVHEAAGRWAALLALLLSAGLWVAAPQPRLHLNTKGQIYAATATGDWIDLSPLPHNKELPPLRFSRLDSHEPCTGSCTHSLPGGDRLIIRPTAPACPPPDDAAAQPGPRDAPSPTLDVEILTREGECQVAFRLALPEGGLSVTLWRDLSGYHTSAAPAARRRWTPETP